MEPGYLIIGIAILIQAIASIYYAFETHQLRKSEKLKIVNEYQNRSTALWIDTEDLRKFIDDDKVDLSKIKKKDVYKRLVQWAKRYFDLCHQKWLLGHHWKSRFSQYWDEEIIEAMKKPFFKQVWEREFKNTWDDKEFNEYIEQCIVKDNTG